MQEQREDQDWQAPHAAPSGAPYQAPDTDEISPEEIYDEVDEQATQTETTDTADDQVLLQWQGTEYIHHDQSKGWYVIMALVVIALMALTILVLKSITFAILIPVMAVALIMYTRRPPAILDYILSRKGLYVNDKLFTFDQFKSFGVLSHGGTHSAVLVPRKRFQIGQTIYFPEEIGEKLVDMLAARLPMKQVEPDAIDKLLARLRL